MRRDGDLLTLEEVTEMLRRQSKRCWWRQQGKGPELSTMGKRLYTADDDVRAFIRKQSLASTPIIG